MPLTASKQERGRRVVDLQTAIFGEGDTNARTLAALRDVAARYGIPVNWDASRLSKIRSGIQNLSLEDVASLVYLAREGSAGGDFGDWFFVAFGTKAPPVQKVRAQTHFGRKTTAKPENKKIG